MLSSVEHEKTSVTSGPDLWRLCLRITFLPESFGFGSQRLNDDNGHLANQVNQLYGDSE